MTLSRRPRLLPAPARGLQAAGAGRFALLDGVLTLDAVGQKLLDAAQASLHIDDFTRQLSEADAQVWQDAIAACLRDAGMLHVMITMRNLTSASAPCRTLWWRGQCDQGRIEGLVMEAPPRGSPASQGKHGQPLQTRDEFVAAISHELRTPLNAILGFGRLARADWPPGADRQHLDHIEQASGLMLRVVNDLLDLTRLEAGELEIKPDQPLSMPALVTRVAVLASSLRQDKPIRLYATVDPHCPPELRGDVGRIEQILLNLVANAMKFTDRGRIVMDVRLRAQTASQVTLRISVADTGGGIPMAQLARIGQPFAQAQDPSMPRTEGTGLGLAVVKHLLALHGTPLRVASVSGGGSTFWFDLTLPLETSVSDAATEPAMALADTVVWSLDDKFVQTVRTQWAAYAQTLLPSERAPMARRWIVDASHPDLGQLAAQARQAGRVVHVVSADPVPSGSDAVPLPHLPRLVFQSMEGDTLRVDPRIIGLKVLVVDDNALNQHVMREFLRRLGADVAVLGEGAQVADMVGKRHFDVILLDIQMPGMDGWQVAKAVRALPHGGQLPIIFLSAHMDAADHAAADALGAHACMVKPFDAPRLQAILADLADEQAGAAQRGFQPQVGAHKPPPSARAMLLTMFSEQWPGQKQAIVDAAPDAQALRQAIHAVRGSLAMLGQPALLALARQHEEALLAGQQLSREALATFVRQVDDLCGVAQRQG